MVFHKSIPEKGEHFLGGHLSLIEEGRFADIYTMRTGLVSTYELKKKMFAVASHKDHYLYIKEQLEYYLQCRSLHGPNRAGGLIRVWLANRKDFLFFRGEDLFLSKEPLALCP